MEMDIEVIKVVNRINEIQDAFVKGSLSYEETMNYRKEWKMLFGILGDKAVSVRRRKVRNQMKWVWSVVSVGSSSSVDFCWVKFAPQCKHSNECTTRVLFFCLGGLMEYDEVRKEQNRIANRIYGRGRCYGWNIRTVWERVLVDRGYVKIVLGNMIRRDRLARMLKDCGWVLTHSSHHCAAIMGGKVYDLWDSSRGKVDYILVKSEYGGMVRDIICK